MILPKTRGGNYMNTREQIIMEMEFTKVNEIKIAKEAFSKLTACPEILINVFVQGQFKIPNVYEDSLNLDYGWYKVTKIGKKYLTIYIPTEEKSFKAEPDLFYISNFDRKPGFRLIAEVFNNVTFRR